MRSQLHFGAQRDPVLLALLVAVGGPLALSPMLRAPLPILLVLGVELRDHPTAAALEEACLSRGLLTLSAGDAAIRISPPLVVSEAQVDRGLELLDQALADVG